MALRPPKEILSRATAAPEPDEMPPELHSQRKRPSPGRYSLQVDRQSKRSFMDFAEAEAAGTALKKKFPIVQVVIYDTVDLTRTVIEAA